MPHLESRPEIRTQNGATPSLPPSSPCHAFMRCDTRPCPTLLCCTCHTIHLFLQKRNKRQKRNRCGNAETRKRVWMKMRMRRRQTNAKTNRRAKAQPQRRTENRAVQRRERKSTCLHVCLPVYTDCMSIRLRANEPECPMCPMWPTC